MYCVGMPERGPKSRQEGASGRTGVSFGPRALLDLASRVDGAGAASLVVELAERCASVPERDRTLAAMVLLSVSYPAIGAAARAHPDEVADCVAEGVSAPRTRDRYIALARAAVGPDLEERAVRKGLRALARRERMRVALREVLPRRLGGADVDVTARELAMLADATIEVALEEAVEWAERRFGLALTMARVPSRFVVLGMGKLGGEELNAGSDVDLIYVYDTDEGLVLPRSARGASEAEPTSMTLHEYWQRVARRVTATLEDVTEDGFVWRVDLRLRPEGSSGPLAISTGAAERYYESFGRLWERAALLRARPVAGDLALGERLLSTLAPFVWRRRIDPSIATELYHLVQRSRVELARQPERDLKLGKGGIREAEFFVQTLQLVWGGKDAALRERPTLAALSRLESKGLCTAREAADIADGYLALRRAEHAVQNASGVQTHALPDGAELERVARVLGFAGAAELSRFLDRHRDRVARRFSSLLPEGAEGAAAHAQIVVAIEQADLDLLRAALERELSAHAVDREEDIVAFAKSLLALGAHPDSILGLRTRESFPGLAETLLDALFEAADPFQAARYLRVFFERVKQPAVYVRLAFADPSALRRLIGVLGASAFIGDALCNNPELGDMILFFRSAPTEEGIRREVLAAVTEPPPPNEDPDEAFVGALRLLKTRLTIEIALADTSGARTMREVNRLLSALADASLEAATRRALGEDVPCGLSIVAMGKLGGREISYGSDLDVLFVYDPQRAPDPSEAPAFFTRVARKVIRYISTFHGAGRGYEIDARLRPSGNQGLLVTSVEAFARHHQTKGAVWERMALVRARPAAGDRQLGDAFMIEARRAAYEAPMDARSAAAEMARIRARVERESSAERGGVFDIKLGRGGLLDIEFIVAFAQVERGAALPEEARTPETPGAIDALARAGALDPATRDVLASAYDFLRRLELRVRIVRADAAHVLDPRDKSLGALARRMGMRDHPARTAEAELLARYAEITASVRQAFDGVFSAPPNSG